MGKPDQFPAWPAGVDFQLGKPREQIHVSTMRASLARNFSRRFHLIQRLLQFGGGKRADHSIAVVAFDGTLLSANDAIQEACTLRVAEITMREPNTSDSFVARAVADLGNRTDQLGPELRPAVWAACIVCAAKGNTSTGL